VFDNVFAAVRAMLMDRTAAFPHRDRLKAPRLELL
jgi:hypothetical protein